MKWGDFIKRTAVRRVVWIVVGLAVYAVLGLISEAGAAVHDTRGEAQAHCMEAAAAAQDALKDRNPPFTDHRCVHALGAPGAAIGRYDAQVFNGSWRDISAVSGHSQIFRHTYLEECAGGQGVWFDGLGRCETACSDRDPMSGSYRWTTSGSSYSPPCVDGCTFEEQGSGLCAGEFCVGRGGLAPTGAQCSTGPTPAPLSSDPDGVCSPIGNNGAQHCVSSGDPARHCIVHASGLSQCWDGTETGPRVNRSGTEGASREMQPATPSPHPNQQAPQVEGSSTAKVSGTSDGGGTFNVVVVSGNGNSADQGDNGSAPGQGSAPGWGNTIGQGPGNSDGTGEGDEGDGPGTPSPGVSDDLYERDARTIAQLYDDYRARVDNAPISQALDNVFSPPQGGSCPTFSLPASAYWEAMVFDFHCREPLSDILAMMGWVVLALAAYLAVRIAFE